MMTDTTEHPYDSAIGGSPDLGAPAAAPAHDRLVWNDRAGDGRQ